MNISQAVPVVCSSCMPFLLPRSLTRVPLSLSLSLTHFPVEVFGAH